MIGQLHVRALAEAPTEESFVEFMVKKHFFKQVGHDVQKMYFFGKDTLRDGLLVKITYTPERGAFATWHLFEQGMSNTWVEASGRPTKALKDMEKWADMLKDAAMRLQSDLAVIEKFLKG